MKVDKFQINFFNFSLLHSFKIHEIMQLTFALSDQPM